MKEIKILDKEFVSFIDFNSIEKRIKQLALQISEDYKGKTPIFIGVLNGVVIFFSEFLKNYSGECNIDFLKISSYSGLKSSDINLDGDLKQNIEARDIVILEDIVDTGNTLVYLKNFFKKKKVNSLKIVSLFLKPDVYNKDVKIDYVGFEIPSDFVVGYGLDYDGYGRNLKDLYRLKI